MVLCTRTDREYPDFDSAIEPAFLALCTGRACSDCKLDTIVPEEDDCRTFSKQNLEIVMDILGLVSLDESDECFEFDENAFNSMMFPTGSPRLSDSNP